MTAMKKGTQGSKRLSSMKKKVNSELWLNIEGRQRRGFERKAELQETDFWR